MTVRTKTRSDCAGRTVRLQGWGQVVEKEQTESSESQPFGLDAGG